MDATMILVAAAAVVAVASIGIAFVALNKFRGKEVSEYTDAAKLGKTRTLKSFRSNGSISWEDFFDPDSQENEQMRSTATYAIIGFYVIAGVVMIAMAYMGLTWGYYFGLLIVGYATLIIGVNYVKARRRKRGETGRV
jgi:Flp pilus assembly protein TadB